MITVRGQILVSKIGDDTLPPPRASIQNVPVYTGTTRTVIKVSMGYCSVGEMKLLVGREDNSKHVFCHWTGIVDKAMMSINDTGNTKIVLKTDGEPALVQVQDRIHQPTVPENPPAYDPQALGGAERGVQEVKRKIEGNQIGISGQSRRGHHEYHVHLGVDDPAGRGYDQQVRGW